MSTPVVIQDLKEKIQILLRHARNPSIRTIEHLATALGMKSPSNFSGYWFLRSRIPGDQLIPFCKLFSVSVSDLGMALSEFEIYISDKRDPWSTIVEAAARSDAIQLLSVPTAVQTRALGASQWKEKLFPQDHFRSDEAVRLELNIGRALSQSSIGGLSHALILVVDSDLAVCLCPSAELAPDCRLLGERLLVPSPNSSLTFLSFYGAKGLHTVYVFFTCGALPSHVYNAAMNTIPCGHPLSSFGERFRATYDLKRLHLIKKEIYVD